MSGSELKLTILEQAKVEKYAAGKVPGIDQPDEIVESNFRSYEGQDAIDKLTALCRSGIKVEINNPPPEYIDKLKEIGVIINGIDHGRP